MNNRFREFSNALRIDLRRAFLGWRFPAVILTVAFLWYINSRRFTNNTDVLSIFFYSIGTSTVTYITITVCTAVYGLSVCEDQQDRFLVSVLSRVSVFNYTVSKLLTCFFATITAYCMGTFLYLLYETVQHPLVDVNTGSLIVSNLQELSTFSFLLPEHTVAFIILQCFLNGLCCSCMAAVAVALSAYIRDSFIVLCIPVITFFLLLFFSNFVLKMSAVDSENIFWIITAEQPCGVFLKRAAAYVMFFYLLSEIVLYKGITRRRQYE